MRLAWLPPAPSDFDERCRSLLADKEGFGKRVAALAAYSLDASGLDRLGAILVEARHVEADLSPLTPFRLGLLTNATPDFLVSSLVATAPRHGLSLEVVTGLYGQFVQDALSPDSVVNRAAPDAVLFALDYRALPPAGSPGDQQSEDASVGGALDQLMALRQSLKRNTTATCIWQTFAPPPETVSGSLDGIFPGSFSRIVSGVNSAIMKGFFGTEDIVLDVAHLASTVGLADWHSPRDWNLAKLPFSDAAVPLYADHVCRTIAALRGRARRCLVLDLDNTLWGGVIGDDGISGIRLAQGDATGEAFLALQRFVLDLRSRGIVLAVCSKNEDRVARLPFRGHPEMLLRESHIAVFQANWTDKPTNIKAIAKELSLGLSSLVFLDDNPAEREAVRQALPEVAVPELPDDPALFMRTLSAAGYFESVAFSKEDLARADFYEQNARRIALEQTASDLEGYLRSLDMEITFQPFDAVGRARIAQLINKSNQFNLTTRRYSESQVLEMECDPRYFCRQVRLSDRFGDNGMISVVICREISPPDWEIDVWLMSCRVLGRRVEQMVLRNILQHAAKRGIQKLRGVYIPTARNIVVSDHYEKLGFSLSGQHEGGTKYYELDVATAPLPDAPMRVRCVCCEPSGQHQLAIGAVTAV
jgi:FkbH-like protein